MVKFLTQNVRSHKRSHVLLHKCLHLMPTELAFYHIHHSDDDGESGKHNHHKHWPLFCLCTKRRKLDLDIYNHYFLLYHLCFVPQGKLYTGTTKTPEQFTCSGVFVYITFSSFRFGVMPLTMRSFSKSSRSIDSCITSSSAIALRALRCVVQASRARANPSFIIFETSASIFADISSEYSRPSTPRPKSARPPEPSRATGPSLSDIPYLVTISRASAVATCKSFDGPVVISPNTISSATYPPSDIAISSKNSFFDWRRRSSRGSFKVYPPACPRAIIEILCTGSACGSTDATSACPASWYAVIFFSSVERM